MKRLIVASSLALLVMPYAANADSWWDNFTKPHHHHHHHISADQLGITGLVLAAAISVIGYLVLRRRAAE